VLNSTLIKGGCVRKIFISSLFILFIFFYYACQPVKEVEQLKVNGSALVNESGDTVVLRGVSYGWHNWWPRFYNAGTVRTFARDWNVSIIKKYE
jgi:endoglucanase